MGAVAAIAMIAGVAVAASGGSDTRAAGTPSGAGAVTGPTNPGGIVAPTGSLEGLSGQWRVTTSNPRILVHTGEFVNATLRFWNGNIRSDRGTASHYTTMVKSVITLTCTRTCYAHPAGVGAPNFAIRNGKLANFIFDGGRCRVQVPDGLSVVDQRSAG